MAGFDRRRRAGIEDALSYRGRGRIQAALYDVGPYPAAVPAPDAFVWGELYEMRDPARLLRTLDAIEGFHPDEPGRSLYVRAEVDVSLPDDVPVRAWVYFYNAPVTGVPRVLSGDYADHVHGR